MKNTVPILLYHSIQDRPPDRFRRWALAPAAFEAHLAYLRDQGYTLLTVSGWISRRRSPAAPERPLLVTFDDGLADFYTNALPLLTRYHAPATLYVVAGTIGQASRWLEGEGAGDQAMMTWEQIAAAAGSSIEIGAHSLSHPALDILDRESAWNEISGSRQALEAGLHRPVRSFAYPHGYHSQATRELVRKAGFSSACAVKNCLSDPEDDALALARIIISNEVDVAALHRLLHGEGLAPNWQGERLATAGWRLTRRALSSLKSWGRLPRKVNVS